MKKWWHNIKLKIRLALFSQGLKGAGVSKEDRKKIVQQTYKDRKR